MALEVPLYGPRWFNGIDSVFEVVMIATAVSIWWTARKAKRLGLEQAAALSEAFFLIALSFAIKVGTNVATAMRLQELGPIFLFSQAVHVQILLALGYFMHRLLFLIALIWLVCLGLHITDWRLKALLVAFAGIGTFFSQYSYVVFHVLALLLLLYVAASSYSSWQLTRKDRCKTVCISFLLVLVSQAVFLFVGMDAGMYVVGESLELLGFVGLLYNQVTLPRPSRPAARV